MSLLSVAPDVIKPTALTLNILVASIGAWQFWRAGYFSWRLFWPFALLSVPLAFVGGYLNLPAQVFKVLVGIILLYSAARFLMRALPEQEPREPPRAVAIASGGVIGFLSGLTGTGGGIFLTPLAAARAMGQGQDSRGSFRTVHPVQFDRRTARQYWQHAAVSDFRPRPCRRRGRSVARSALTSGAGALIPPSSRSSSLSY